MLGCPNVSMAPDGSASERDARCGANLPIPAWSVFLEATTHVHASQSLDIPIAKLHEGPVTLQLARVLLIGPEMQKCIYKLIPDYPSFYGTIGR